MTLRIAFRAYACSALASFAVFSGAHTVLAQQPGQVDAEAPDPATSSAEQGQTPLTDTFETGREWRVAMRRQAIQDTQFRFNIRTFYFDREKFDGTESQAWAIGGWAGAKTGYFLDHISLGLTGYTSQKLSGDKDKDGTLLLAPGQEGYSVLGEAYVDLRIIDDLNLYVGRKEFDSPFINRNDVRMTPNTFEMILLQGKAKLGSGGATLRYGGGYIDTIKERNSDEFVSMAKDAGAKVNRGVYTLGAVFEKGKCSVGAIEYWSPDIINIGYAEAKVEIPINEDWKVKVAGQFTDQRSVGDNLLLGYRFSAQQYGIKADVSVKKALFTVGYTYNTDGADMQNPWSVYPGYTSVQVQEFHRAGEGAWIVRGSYEFTKIKGLSLYALAVFGTEPDAPGQYRQNEYDANLQWVPPEGFLKGLSLRLRYALAQQDGGDVQDLRDFRVICNYERKF